MILDILDRFLKNIQIPNFMKSVQCEPRSSMLTNGQTDRQTDMMKLLVAFHSFANMPKILDNGVILNLGTGRTVHIINYISQYTGHIKHTGSTFRKTEQPLVMEGYCKYCVLNIQLPKVGKGWSSSFKMK